MLLLDDDLNEPERQVAEITKPMTLPIPDGMMPINPLLSVAYRVEFALHCDDQFSAN